MAAIIWLIVAVALGVAEVFTTALFISMFAVGALAAAGVAAVGGGILLQVLAFGGVSAMSLWLLRPALQRTLKLSGGAGDAIGPQAIEGATVTVLEEIDADHGLVNIEGETWRARPFDASEKYPVGERVRVLEIKGATAIVWKD